MTIPNTLASGQVDRAEQLARRLAEWLHHWLCSAQNLPWEEGDCCVDCEKDVHDMAMPIIRTALDEAVREGRGSESGELQAANKFLTERTDLLRINPACERGHRMCDWVEGAHKATVGNTEHICNGCDPSYCRACRSEDAAVKTAVAGAYRRCAEAECAVCRLTHDMPVFLDNGRCVHYPTAPEPTPCDGILFHKWADEAERGIPAEEKPFTGKIADLQSRLALAEANAQAAAVGTQKRIVLLLKQKAWDFDLCIDPDMDELADEVNALPLETAALDKVVAEAMKGTKWY